MSTPPPHTPDGTPRKMPLTRSFTLPAKAASSSRTAPAVEIGATEGVETLYFHPNSRIVKFVTTAPSKQRGDTDSSSQGGDQAQGTLPWATQTEQTVAAGPLEIYRVPGSVSFLRSRAFLHAILPRSKCWCVDGVSKFAMRVRFDTYYRIELPGTTAEDLEMVEMFKETLKKVLYFERTACPFARTFTVDLPEEPQVRKKKRRYHGPAKKWKLEKAYSWKPEDGGEPPPRESEQSSGSVSPSDDEVFSSTDEGSDASEIADQVRELKVTTPSRPSVRDRARGFDQRSVTAPPQMAIQSTPPSRLRMSEIVDETVHERTDHSDSLEQTPATSDTTTLRPFQAIPTDMPPSPPDSSAGVDFTEIPPRSAVHSNDQDQTLHSVASSESHYNEHMSALQANSPEADLAPADSSLSSSGQSDGPFSAENQDGDTNEETLATTASDSQDPFAQIQARIQARRSIGGTTSFHLNPKSPTRQSSSSTASSGSSLASSRSAASRRAHHSQQQQQAFATALVHKACSTFLGPPAHLVMIMLRIAARFAKGVFPSALIFESPAGVSKRVPGSFDLDSSDVEDFGLDNIEGLDWEEDDFGVPLLSPIRLASDSGAPLRDGAVSTALREHVRGRGPWTAASDD